MEYIPTRMTKVSTPKPAANPLQFVKVGPCDLFKSAQETLKKVEEVKKMKREVRDEAEEWQSNLDNWKCSRRKRVEHIIDRVVEVKKLELEEHERNRRKAKTFSEMMEERTSRGRKMSLLVHKDDDSNDLSDLGIGTSSDKSSVSEDYGNDDNHSVGDGEDSVKNHYIDQNGNSQLNSKSANGINGNHDDDTSTSTTISSPEPEEYTYDRAIQGYVNFTETRVKSRTSSQVSRTEADDREEMRNGNATKAYGRTTPKNPPVPPSKPRKESIKVEEEISDLERIQSRKYSGSSNDVSSPEKKLNVPKVDILKRKELFERPNESCDQSEQSKVAPRAAGDLANSKSIRDRVSNFARQKSEENAEKSKQMKRLSGEISVKDRLTLLEKQKSTENISKSSNGRLSMGDLSNASRTIKDRLSSLEQLASQESQEKACRTSVDSTCTSVKDRMSELETPKETVKKVTPDRDPTFRDKLANFRSSESDANSSGNSKNTTMVDSSVSSPSLVEDDVYHKRAFHRSLDSLDVDSSSQISNEAFERVQSMEDLDSCGQGRNYPASASSNENLVFSSQSGDTDREDSGIHTADVSCSVSQADEPADVGDLNLAGGSALESESTYLLESERRPENGPPMIVSQLTKLHLSEKTFQDLEGFPSDRQRSETQVSNSTSIVVSSDPGFDTKVVDDLSTHPDSPSKTAVNSSKPCDLSPSNNLSPLPTIPEVTTDSPPLVIVSDTDLISPDNQKETAFQPDATSSPIESTQPDITMTEVSKGDEEGSSSTPPDSELSMPSSEMDKTTVLEEIPAIEVEPHVSLCGTVSPSVSSKQENDETHYSGSDDEDDSVFLVTEILVGSDVEPDSNKGPKPFSSTLTSTDSQAERDMASVTSAETDTDVSSFLEQALLEEDLKMNESGQLLTEENIVNKRNNEYNSAINKPFPRESQQQLYSGAIAEVPSVDLSVDVLPGGIPIAFPLDAPTAAEPPKEKPPPPPTELSDEEGVTELSTSNNTTSGTERGSVNLRRLDSTKRIKKEIRRKRSDFLGIEGTNDDSYFEPELKVAPPPDMTSFLQEERRLEQELYRQTQPAHYFESDQGSNQSEQIYQQVQQQYTESDQGSNQGESRDSGVELDSHLNTHNMNTDDNWVGKQLSSPGNQSSETHSRQNSEPFGNASSASEEDEIVKKEREIIEILEKEEQWRYGTNTILSPSDHHQVGEKLAAKLRELEQEKMHLEWERAEEARRVAAEQAARQEEQRRIRMKEQQLRQQENIVGRVPVPAEMPLDCDTSDLTPEELREERERLRREHAELERQREILASNQVDHKQSWDSASSAASHRSLQDVSGSPFIGSHSQLVAPTNNAPLNYRLSLPDLQQSDASQLSVAPRTAPHHRRPPPPIPPAKPLSAVSQERRGLNNSPRQGHLQSSADSLPLALDPQHHRHNAVGLPSVPLAPSPTSSTGSQQMTRQTLHALSAAPRSKIIASETWVQAKRKPESQRNSNRDHYQHWLIQEAEHRRITEQQQRNAASRKSAPPAQTHHKMPVQPVQPVQPLQPVQPVQPVQPTQIPQQWQQYPHHQHPHHQHPVPHQHQHPHHQHPHQQPPPPPSHMPAQTGAPPRQEKPLPDAIIQTLTQRVQNRVSLNENSRRVENSPVRDARPMNQVIPNSVNNNNSANLNHNHSNGNYTADSQEKMLSVSGKKKCSHCNEELGRGAAMIIESLRLFYHMDCFKCCVCHVQLGDGLMGTDVRVRNHKLHCHNCYSSDDGVKFSCV